jgi:hypothetical protein
MRKKFYCLVFVLFAFIGKSKSDMLNCTEYTCDDKRAICIGFQNATCLCSNQYDTFPEDNLEMCNYVKKSQLTAFLLETFVTFGIGHFYSERYVNAVFKCIVWIIGIILLICLRYHNKDNIGESEADDDQELQQSDKENEKDNVENLNSNTLIISLLGCFVTVIIIVWLITDIVMFGLNLYLDGNGVELVSMIQRTDNYVIKLNNSTNR